jgi:MoxR-like ATPase
VLNGLKQEKFQFPDKLIPIHKDFRFIATANTLEFDESYNARSPLDKATLARFDKIEYGMQPHELAIRYGINYIKGIDKIEKLTPREVSRLVIKAKIKQGVDNE